MTPTPQPKALEPDLQCRIMNIPCDRDTLDWANTREAYMYGHRDARHAAAELASDADTELRRQHAEIEALKQQSEIESRNCKEAWDALNDHADSLRAEVEQLRAALQGLLNDTQHSLHDCGDADCPVAIARAALGAARESKG